MMTALFALLSAIIAAVVTLLVADRTRYVNAVTTQRSAWIEKLRNNIAKYSGRIRHVANTITNIRSSEKADLKTELEKQLSSFVSELNELNPLIKLQLNPFGEIDRNIVTLLDKLTLLAAPLKDVDPAKFFKADELLIEHSRWLLKAEWDKVKSEARWTVRGWVLRNRVEEQERDHLDLYRAFVRCDGSLSKIDDP
jgi:gas vesicle protein